MSEIRVFNDPVPTGGYPFYAWYVGEDNEERTSLARSAFLLLTDQENRTKNSRRYFFACVTNERFYVSQPLESVTKRITESNRLQQEHPDSVFKNGRAVDLREIDEARCTKTKARLELVRNGSIVFRVTDEKSKQCRKMFDDVRARLAPRNPVEEADFPAIQSLGLPVAATAAALVIGAVLCMAANAPSEEEFGGRRGGLGRLIQSLAVGLTFQGCLALTALAVMGGLAWLAYRFLHPLKYDMVRLK